MKIILTANNLNKIFDCCKNFIVKDNIRPIYRCVHLECKNGVCNAYAMDGYKACMKSVSYKGDDVVVDIPIVKLPVLGEENVNILIGDDYITFDFFSEKHTYRKVEGQFADITDYFEDNNPAFKILFDPKLLIKALKSFEKEKCVELNFFDDSLKPCVVTATDAKCVVLPLRCSEEAK